jgi:hypothetical protein
MQWHKEVSFTLTYVFSLLELQQADSIPNRQWAEVLLTLDAGQILFVCTTTKVL